MHSSNRVPMPLMSRFLRAKGLILDVFERTVSVAADGTDGAGPRQCLIELTNTEFKLLYCLMASPDMPQTRSYLLQTVWKIDQPIITNRVDVAINQLRRRIGYSLVVSVRGQGYMLSASHGHISVAMG